MLSTISPTGASENRVASRAINRWVNTFDVDYFDGVVNFQELNKQYPDSFELKGDKVTFFRLFIFVPSKEYVVFWKAAWIVSFGAMGWILGKSFEERNAGCKDAKWVPYLSTIMGIVLGVLITNKIPDKPGIYFW